MDAVDKLKKNTISLVATDLQMPRMDGFALLAHLSENYPDVPVIVFTGHGTPKSKRAILEKGAAGYIEKPFKVEDLAQKVIATLKKESEGGILQTIPLEMFIQLIEMEQKTCTIRIVNKSTGKQGVLFFRDGDLLDARFREIQGKPAAYEIFSWDKITLSIQDTCAIKEKRIDEELQAILFDAMRLKDEAEGNGENEAENKEKPADETMDVKETEKDMKRSELPKVPVTDIVRHKLEKVMGEKNVLENIYQDSSWDYLLTQTVKVGKFFRAGILKSCYINRGESTDFILLPGDETTVITVSPNCPRDRILQVLSE
jgi:CheY-like chemotaxis protein